MKGYAQVRHAQFTKLVEFATIEKRKQIRKALDYYYNLAVTEWAKTMIGKRYFVHWVFAIPVSKKVAEKYIHNQLDGWYPYYNAASKLEELGVMNTDMCDAMCSLATLRDYLNNNERELASIERLVHQEDHILLSMYDLTKFDMTLNILERVMSPEFPISLEQFQE